VALWVPEDGRISVDPIGLLVEDPPSVPPATVTAVDDLLVAAGRLRQDSRGVRSNPLISWLHHRECTQVQREHLQT